MRSAGRRRGFVPFRGQRHDPARKHNAIQPYWGPGQCHNHRPRNRHGTPQMITTGEARLEYARTELNLPWSGRNIRFTRPCVCFRRPRHGHVGQMWGRTHAVTSTARAVAICCRTGSRCRSQMARCSRRRLGTPSASNIGHHRAGTQLSEGHVPAHLRDRGARNRPARCRISNCAAGGPQRGPASKRAQVSHLRPHPGQQAVAVLPCLGCLGANPCIERAISKPFQTNAVAEDLGIAAPSSPRDQTAGHRPGR